MAGILILQNPTVSQHKAITKGAFIQFSLQTVLQENRSLGFYWITYGISAAISKGYMSTYILLTNRNLFEIHI